MHACSRLEETFGAFPGQKEAEELTLEQIDKLIQKATSLGAPSEGPLEEGAPLGAPEGPLEEGAPLGAPEGPLEEGGPLGAPEGPLEETAP
ncbi:hypothetical protein, conserved [Eimeria necatrix]|uniref:Uncharacterized protein n=1 Tax=Eimeria necatrix TaxID=51315 RepID=U6MS34_9EIME|nr:hypothetical protein, conserved [Eimeria necatrix]CDJ65279.1 hypothetical protein, conserved [Eimeria necatrix]